MWGGTGVLLARFRPSSLRRQREEAHYSAKAYVPDLSGGWGGLLLALIHAARYHGAAVVRVDPAYTSLTCYACKHVARGSRESRAVFRCVAFGRQDNADVDAARNILAAGLAVTGRGDLAVGRSAKRQPPERPAA
ncbi:zinc ribbon domain-containing protein [Micromonospora sp. RTP1Z1]|uniref:zinc ribbon domain-containing protein n=1 Tax=Micromonospora sp. RTP1Z1 TaxID=2994043 RepID=UPI0039B43B3D